MMKPCMTPTDPSTARAQFVFTSYSNANLIQPPVPCDVMLHDSNRSQSTSEPLPFYFILYAYLIQAAVQGRVLPSSTPNGEISSVYPSPIYHGKRTLWRPKKMKVGDSCNVWCLLTCRCLMLMGLGDWNTWNTFSGSKYGNDNNKKTINETEYSISNQTENWKSAPYLYTNGDTPINDFKKELKGEFAYKQMVLEIVRWGGWATWALAKSNLKGRSSGSIPLRSDGSQDGLAGRLDHVSGG